MPRDVQVHNAHPRLKVDRKAVTRVIHILDTEFSPTPADRLSRQTLPEGELSIAFLTDQALAGLHGDFLDDPSTTDVITFEVPPGLGSVGEICVSADTASTFAKEHGHDFATELTLYVVHGWLHLLGYDDLQPAKKRRMRAAEARCLKLLKGNIPAFSWKR